MQNEIDSWCVKVNDDNVKIVKKYFTDYPNNAFQNGSVYGIDKTKIQNYLQKSESGNYISLFDRLITTEEFYEKIGHKVEKKSLVGRYLKVLKNDRKDHNYLLINYEGTVEGRYKTLEYPEEWMNISFRIKIGEFELMPEDFVPPNEKKYDYEVVHCTTQEELNFACKILESHETRIAPYCVHLDGGFDSVDRCKKNSNYKIYSFQEWCEKFGHKPDFNKSIEKWSVGSYVVFVVDYGGHPKGSFSKITKNEDKCVVVELVFEDKKQGCRLYKNTECEWFPTLKEAEEFAKSLVEATEKYVECLTNSPTSFTYNISREELIKEAKKRFSIGTKFKDLVHNEVFTVSLDKFDFFGKDDYIYVHVEKNSRKNRTARIYKNGVWAEILETSKSTPLQVMSMMNEIAANVVPGNNRIGDRLPIVPPEISFPLKYGCPLPTLSQIRAHQSSNKKGKKFSPIKAELINVKKLKIKK